MTDQYAGYRFIDSSQRQLCWAHVLRNVAAIATAAKRSISPLGPDWCFSQIAYSGFDMAMNKALSQKQYQRRLERCRQSWRKELGRDGLLQQALPRSLSATAKDDEMLWRFLENDEIAFDQ